jgi:hypothetical protein
VSKLALAWAWVKKNWHWVVLPVGILLYLMGRAGRKPPVVSPALVQHFEVVAKAEEKAQEQTAAAQAVHDEKVETVNHTHDQVIQRIKEADARTEAVLADDPIALNRFLKQVGRDQRSS